MVLIEGKFDEKEEFWLKCHRVESPIYTYISHQGKDKYIPSRWGTYRFDNTEYGVVIIAGTKVQWIEFSGRIAGILKSVLIPLEQALQVPEIQEHIIYNLNLFSDEVYDSWLRHYDHLEKIGYK